jgi:hypothetical protein
LAVLWLVANGFGAVPVILGVVAILLFEYADYSDYAVFRRRINAREMQPCLTCKKTGKVGKRRCPDCGGRGWVVAPPDRGRPPIT